MALSELGEPGRVGVGLRVAQGRLGLGESRLDVLEPGYQALVHQLSVWVEATSVEARTAIAIWGTPPRFTTSSAV